jgi:hypothetical protein
MLSEPRQALPQGRTERRLPTTRQQVTHERHRIGERQGPLLQKRAPLASLCAPDELPPADLHLLPREAREAGVSCDARGSRGQLRPHSSGIHSQEGEGGNQTVADSRVDLHRWSGNGSSHRVCQFLRMNHRSPSRRPSNDRNSHPPAYRRIHARPAVLAVPDRDRRPGPRVEPESRDRDSALTAFKKSTIQRHVVRRFRGAVDKVAPGEMPEQARGLRHGFWTYGVPATTEAVARVQGDQRLFTPIELLSPERPPRRTWSPTTPRPDPCTRDGSM